MMRPAPAPAEFSAVPAEADRLPRIRAEWNALVERMRYPTVFCGWEWVTTWWEHFGAGRELRVLLIYRANELKGILPLYLTTRLSARSARIGRVLAYCSAEDLYPDPLDMICAEGDAEACAAAVLSYLAGASRDWDILHLRFMQENSQLFRTTHRAGAYGSRAERVSAASYVSLTGSYADYVGQLSVNERSNVRRRRRKLFERAGIVYADMAAMGAAAALERLVDLHGRRAAEKGIASSFARPEVVAFHRDLLDRIDPRRVWLRGLQHDGDIIAAFYGFIAGRTLSYYQLGYDPAWSEYSPGSVLLQETIREAFETGLAEYNFLQGQEAFKQRWANQSRRLYGVDLFNRTLCGRLSRSLGAARALFRTVEEDRAAMARAVNG